MSLRSPVTLISMLATACFPLFSMSCGGDEGNPACAAITGYTPTVAGPLSYATDIHPIMSNTVFQVGCSQTAICHGTPAMNLDPAMMKTLSLIDAAPTVKASLLNQVPVNAPGMKLVVPSNLGASFLAYKLYEGGLSCVNAMCISGASVGASKPCGDEMPVGGVLTPAERTKILDWIALGAAD